MTTDTVGLRITPPSLVHSRRARYLLERNVRVYRRLWVIVFSGFFEPLFYLFSIGVGMGVLIGDVTGPGGQPVTYAQFVAPGLLAASAMNGAVFESTMNIFFKLKYGKIYDAILATPIGTNDIAVGEITWSLIRGAIYATGFLVVMLGMGLMPSMWGLLALPAATLIGFAFAAIGMATTTFMKSWQDFDLVTLATMPMFLFSATFFPIDTVAPWLQTVIRISPLYHGVELIRSLTLGIFDVSLFGHVGYLLAMGLAGMMVVNRRLEKLLKA